MEHTSHITPLSQVGISRAELCRCGEVHVTVGPLTLRLPALHFEELTRCLAMASQQRERLLTESASRVPAAPAAAGRPALRVVESACAGD